ncbi:HVCN1 [Bugula neritina]|uniref:Voltage-gated hydrogen channel 1 n=1 Tax=Bugula neritina TaxID=10212 RepID=A0A7J7JXP5_BUGNE|nr:HVCN1 [Bugula neritina]
MGKFKSSNNSDFKQLELDDKLYKALRQDSADTDVIAEELKSLNDDVLDHSNTKIQARLERFLESTPLEVFLVVLVVVDVIILLAMLLLDLHVLNLYLEDGRKAANELTRGLQANCEGNIELKQYNESNLVTVTRLLTHSGCIWQEDFNSLNHSQELHVRNKRAAGQAEEGTNPTITLLLNIAHAFHLTSVVILAIMVAEVLLKIFAMGIKYFKGKLEVVDGIVIFISFAMDIYFIYGVSPESVNNGATILVIFLLWRILRVFNALLVTAKKRLQFRIRVQKRMRKALEDKIENLSEEIKSYEDYVANLCRLAKSYDISDYKLKACKPLVKQIKRPSTSAGLASMMQMSMGLMHGMNNMAA